MAHKSRDSLAPSLTTSRRSVRSNFPRSVTFASHSNLALDESEDPPAYPFQPDNRHPIVTVAESSSAAATAVPKHSNSFLRRTLRRLTNKPTLDEPVFDPSPAHSPLAEHFADSQQPATESSTFRSRRHALAKLARQAFSTSSSKPTSRSNSLRQPPPAASRQPAKPALSVRPPSRQAAPPPPPGPPDLSWYSSSSTPQRYNSKYRPPLDHRAYDRPNLSLSQPPPPTHSRSRSADRGLLPPSPVSPTTPSSESHPLSRFGRRIATGNRSRSTVQLEHIPEVVSYNGQTFINPETLRESPDQSDSPPSWWNRSGHPSQASLNEPESTQVSRPVSDALFPYSSELSLAEPSEPVQPRSLVQLTPRSKPKTPKSILKSPSRSFFRRASSPPPPLPPPPSTKPDFRASYQGALFATARSLSVSAPDLLAPEEDQQQQQKQLTNEDSNEPFSAHSPATDVGYWPAPTPFPYHESISPTLAPPTNPDSDSSSSSSASPDDSFQSRAQTDETDPVPEPPTPGSFKSRPFSVVADPDKPPPPPLENPTDDTMGAKDNYWRDEGINFAADDEEEFENMQWFQDRPAKPEAPPPQTAGSMYQPLPNVIEDNERFIMALKGSPRVMYQRYKDFGQMGVFGWTAELSELIDALKTLGFEGNMFVSTREAALTACEKLLSLVQKLEIEMQIIIMYLSSQVARLRRFLDSERQWNDYPKPNFPSSEEMD